MALRLSVESAQEPTQRRAVDKVREHVTGLVRIIHAPPHVLAFALGLLSMAWGFCVAVFPDSWTNAPFYSPLVYFVPAAFVGVPMFLSGLIQVVAATNGIMLSKIAQLALVVQACTWGAVSCTAVVTSPLSTGTTNYFVLALLSLLLFWQWRSAARRAGKLPPV